MNGIYNICINNLFFIIIMVINSCLLNFIFVDNLYILFKILMIIMIIVFSVIDNIFCLYKLLIINFIVILINIVNLLRCGIIFWCILCVFGLFVVFILKVNLIIKGVMISIVMKDVKMV